MLGLSDITLTTYTLTRFGLQIVSIFYTDDRLPSVHRLSNTFATPPNKISLKMHGFSLPMGD